MATLCDWGTIQLGVRFTINARLRTSRARLLAAITLLVVAVPTFRAAVPSGDDPLIFQVGCPRNGTAVLKRVFTAVSLLFEARLRRAADKLGRQNGVNFFLFSYVRTYVRTCDTSFLLSLFFLFLFRFYWEYLGKIQFLRACHVWTAIDKLSIVLYIPALACELLF